MPTQEDKDSIVPMSSNKIFYTFCQWPIICWNHLKDFLYMQLSYTIEKYSRNESYLSVSLCHSLCEKQREYSVNAWEEDVLFARLLSCKDEILTWKKMAGIFYILIKNILSSVFEKKVWESCLYFSQILRDQFSSVTDIIQSRTDVKWEGKKKEARQKQCLITGKTERKERKTALKMVIYNIFCISIR